MFCGRNKKGINYKQGSIIKKISQIAVLLGVFFIIFSIKLVLIAEYGNSVPFWDQWDAEADFLYLPWVEGRLELSQLFAPHNEHRILWTRLLGIAELEFNGGIWDPLFQMLVNAALHSLAILIFLTVLKKELPKQSFHVFAFMGILLFGIPYGWENTLSGFQSQFYFMLLFGFISIAVLIKTEPLGVKWFCGYFLLILSCFSLSSGFLAGVAVSGCYVLQMIYARKINISKVTGIILLGIYSTIAYLMIPVNDGHEALKASSIQDFIVAFAKSLSFPFPNNPAMAFIIQMPFLIMLSISVIKTEKSDNSPKIPWILMAVGIWVWLNAAATAYGRGQGGGAPASRYMDTITVGIMLNYALLFFIRQKFNSRIILMGVCLWVLVVSVGSFNYLSDSVIPELKSKERFSKIQASNLRNYLYTGNRDLFKSQPYFHIPYPSAERLIMLLDNPNMRNMLPSELLSSVKPKNIENKGFRLDGYYPTTPSEEGIVAWGSYGVHKRDLVKGQLRWEFNPIDRGHYLQLSVAGYPTREGMGIKILNDSSNTKFVDFPKNPREKWETYTFKTPDKAFSIIAEDQSESTWLALTYPHPVGRGTYFTKITLEHWFVFMGLGVFFVVMPLFFKNEKGNQVL